MVSLILVVCALLLALWSLASWGLYLLLSLDPAWVETLREHLDGERWGAWLEQWIPGAQYLTGWMLDTTRWVVGVLADHAFPTAFGVWALGAAVILVPGLLLAALVRRWTMRRRATPTAVAA